MERKTMSDINHDTAVVAAYALAEVDRLSALADKWNFECDEMREDNKRLESANRDLLLWYAAAIADAKRYQQLAAYLVSDDLSLDDDFVACTTVDEISAILDLTGGKS